MPHKLKMVTVFPATERLAFRWFNTFSDRG